VRADAEATKAKKLNKSLETSMATLKDKNELLVAALMNNKGNARRLSRPVSAARKTVEVRSNGSQTSAVEIMDPSAKKKRQAEAALQADEIELLHAAVKKAESKTIALQLKVDEQRSAIAQLKQKSEKSRATTHNVKTISKASQRKTEQKIASLKAKVAHLGQDKKTLQDRLKAADSATHQAKARLSDNLSSKTETHKLLQTVKHLERELSKMRGERRKWKQTQDTQSAEKSAGDAEKQAAQLAKQRDRSHRDSERLAGLQKKLLDADLTIVQLKQQLETLHSVKDTQEKHFLAFEHKERTLHKEFTELNSRFRKQSVMLSDFQSGRRVSKMYTPSLHDVNPLVKGQILAPVQKKHHEETLALHKILDQQKVLCEELKQQLVVKNQDVMTLHGQLAQAQVQIGDRVELESTILKGKQQLAESVQETNQARKLLKGERDDVKRFTQALEKLQSEAAELTDRLRVSEHEHVDKDTTIADLTKQLLKVTEARDKLHNTLHESVRNRKSKKLEMSHQLQTLSETVFALQRQIVVTEQSHDVVQYTQLKQQLESANHEAAVKTKQLRDQLRLVKTEVLGFQLMLRDQDVLLEKEEAEKRRLHNTHAHVILSNKQPSRRTILFKNKQPHVLSPRMGGNPRPAKTWGRGDRVRATATSTKIATRSKQQQQQQQHHTQVLPSV
jgi:hypothetical protein